MAITALKLAAVTDYISKYDTDAKDNPSEATVWNLGTLDSRISGLIQDKTTKFSVDTTGADNDTAETSVQVNQVNFERVQYGLRGFRNFKDENGNDIPFKTLSKNVGGKNYRYVHPDIMELIPGNVIKELAEQIAKLNEVSTDLGNE